MNSFTHSLASACGSALRWSGLCAAVLTVATVTATPAGAQYTWNNPAGGNWSVAGNWTGGKPTNGARTALVISTSGWMRTRRNKGARQLLEYLLR